MNKQQTQKGYTLLLLVLIVASISTTAVLSLSTINVNALKTSRVIEKYNQAKALADGCIELALQEIRDSETTSGTDTFSLDEGSCEYTISNSGGESRDIIATGTVDEVVRKVEVSIGTINPQITIDSWQEVSTF